MDTFTNYTRLKIKIDFVYKGIYLNRAVALSLWNIAAGKKAYSFKNNAKILSRLTIPPKSFELANDIYATFGWYTRKDHKELFTSVINKLGNNVTCEYLLTWKRRFYLNLGNIFHVSKYFFSLKESGLNLKNKLGLISEVVYYCNFIDELESVDTNRINKYLCTMSHMNLENVMTQFFNKKGINTYSLEEGIYFIFKNDIPLDCLIYENMETSHLLAWSQYVIDEYISYGINANRLLLAGYPKTVHFSEIKENNTFSKCMILLARKSYNEANMKLLEILSRYSQDVEFFLKLHPSLDFSLYQEYAQNYGMSIIPMSETINECLDKDKFDFAIAVNTTAYYEALMRGVPCLRYNDGTFNLPKGCDDIFETSEEYYSKIAVIKKEYKTSYKKTVNQVLRDVVGVGIDRYRELLQSE